MSGISTKKTCFLERSINLLFTFTFSPPILEQFRSSRKNNQQACQTLRYYIEFPLMIGKRIILLTIRYYIQMSCLTILLIAINYSSLALRKKETFEFTFSIPITWINRERKSNWQKLKKSTSSYPPPKLDPLLHPLHVTTEFSS